LIPIPAGDTFLGSTSREVEERVVSLVLPVFNERDNLEPVIAELTEALRSVRHEVIAVDDGSTDGSLERLRDLTRAFPNLRTVVLQTHTGQSAAIAAGFDAAGGGVIVTMDADGQNDPADIPAMLTALEADARLTAVVGFRTERRDSRWKRVQSRVANTVRSWITADGIRDTGCSLKAMRADAVRRLPRFDGMHRFLPALIQYHGGVVREHPVRHRPRLAGRSKYGMWRRAVRGVHDAFGVRWMGRRALRYTVTRNGSARGRKA
jgi:glycosyltransferase involved in cell wall biosynthesis